MEEESWRRNHGEGIMEEESWEEESWEEDSWEEPLGSICEASGGHLGSIWKASGAGASGRPLGSIWGASGRHPP